MNIPDLASLFEYGSWQSESLFPVLAELTTEEFTRNVAGAYGSIRNTLVHAVSAQWGWLDRCGGAPRGPALKADDYPTVDSLVQRWREVEGYTRHFLSGLTDEGLSRVVEFSFGGGPTHALTVEQILRHAATHSVHHRAQASLLLRTLGHAPPNIDLLRYWLR
jgi:uncharacterized damage-inducible protein DinB